MWEANVRNTVSEIIANLHREKHNWEQMVYTVSDLAVEVGLQNPAGLVEPSAPIAIMNNQKACDVHAELEGLEAALSGRNVSTALEHAEAVLRVLGTSPK